ncbi:MAG: peroxiredoxin [Propionibacteriaceae bacterium]|jgi:peroxiredoxin Q/BCP|nr:peroxiredoxin [Propionibacteriaceae bacterium]
MTRLQPGDAAPAFTLPDAHDQLVSLADFGPGKVIVYFYPAALTPGCSTEAKDFSASAEDFAQAGYRIVGISPDPAAKLDRFIERYDLAITLLSDPSHAVIEAWGAWGERVIWGKTITGVIRSTFVVEVDADGQGTIVDAQYNVRATGHVARQRKALGLN